MQLFLAQKLMFLVLTVLKTSKQLWFKAVGVQFGIGIMSWMGQFLVEEEHEKHCFVFFLMEAMYHLCFHPCPKRRPNWETAVLIDKCLAMEMQNNFIIGKAFRDKILKKPPSKYFLWGQMKGGVAYLSMRLRQLMLKVPFGHWTHII